MAKSEQHPPYVLGLDLGVQSVGWAILDLDRKGKPCRVRRAGVRCFDSGVGSEKEIEMGVDESANAKRRQARMQRRQTWRRARRMKKVFQLLQRAGLLPAGPSGSPTERDELLKTLDRRLLKEEQLDGDRISAHLLPYRLRAKSLDEALSPHALGRALYHLAQRRGFLSNRKSQKDDEEEGVVKTGIAELHQKLAASGARTLGEYFAGLDPEQDRIRGRWTDRKTMLVPEFEAIWAAQCRHHALMTPQVRNELYRAIFFQRPLKSQESLVGWCELEKTHRRAPLACLDAQRIRYWQKINDLEVFAPDGAVRRLTPEQKEKLAEELEHKGDASFHRIRTLLKLVKPKGDNPGHSFNLEQAGDKGLIGNRTNAKLVKLLDKAWLSMPEEQQDRLVNDLIEYENRDALAQRLTQRYAIPKELAEQAADLTLESGYHSLSRVGIRKLLPLLRDGKALATARKEVYGEQLRPSEGIDKLPPVLEALPNLRNPVVCRGLTELRKVVNALIREYGKPALIRVELARDLKRSRKERERITKENNANRKAREEARQFLIENGIRDPKGGDILKYLLWKECNQECPYTGKPISKEALFDSPQFEVEHIIPFSRSLDNSFQNKTLCYMAENRDRKRNRTPFEAYSGSPEAYSEMLARVARFRGSAARAKLRRFCAEEIPDDFVDRQLNDTRYMSRLAGEYLGLLYGGVIDATGRRVQVSAGRITAFLREDWGLDAILGGGQVRDAIPPAEGERQKNRYDHRHHAVDAVVIAMTDAGTVKLLSGAAQAAEYQGHRLFAPVDPPWPTFLDEIRAAVDAINVSYRVNRRVSGRLHKDNFYSFRASGDAESAGSRSIRKRLENMSARDVDRIVDGRIRAIVEEKIQQLGGDWAKQFADSSNLPYFRCHDGRVVPIRSARVRESVNTRSIGSARARRHVVPGNNHHMEILASVDAKGNESRWDGVVVSLLDAGERRRNKGNVIRREHGEGKIFRFSISGNEYLELVENDVSRLYRVIAISDGEVEIRLHTDARPSTLLKKTPGARAGKRPSPARLFEAKARKVVVDPLGNVLPAND